MRQKKWKKQLVCKNNEYADGCLALKNGIKTGDLHILLYISSFELYPQYRELLTFCSIIQHRICGKLINN